jgi:hypothetical protein
LRRQCALNLTRAAITAIVVSGEIAAGTVRHTVETVGIADAASEGRVLIDSSRAVTSAPREATISARRAISGGRVPTSGNAKRAVNASRNGARKGNAHHARSAHPEKNARPGKNAHHATNAHHAKDRPGRASSTRTLNVGVDAGIVASAATVKRRVPITRPRLSQSCSR